MPSLLGGPWEDLNRPAGLGCPVPSSAVSDEQPSVVWQWFLSACEWQSLLCLDQQEAGKVLGALQPAGQPALKMGVPGGWGLCSNFFFLYLDNNEKNEKSL